LFSGALGKEATPTDRLDISELPPRSDQWGVRLKAGPARVSGDSTNSDVDDEPANVELLKAFLEDVADEIRGVTDPRRLRKWSMTSSRTWCNWTFNMPGMDGLTLLRRLSKVRDNAGYLPVIVLTVDNDGVARDSALELEADDFPLKPLDRQEVRLRVRNLLQARHLFKEVTRKTGPFPRIKRSP